MWIVIFGFWTALTGGIVITGLIKENARTP